MEKRVVVDTSIIIDRKLSEVIEKEKPEFCRLLPVACARTGENKEHRQTSALSAPNTNIPATESGRINPSLPVGQRFVSRTATMQHGFF